MSIIPVLKVKDAEGNWIDISALKGDKGDKGDKGNKGDKGEKGDTGNQGADGYTPIKGTDYWTEEDKKEIISNLSIDFANVPEFYTKETIEGMNSITTMKHGDMCIILSGDTTAQSIYRYYVNDISGNPLSTPQWVWVTDLSLFAPQPVLEITDGTWDYSMGNSAKITLTADTSLTITNVYSGAYGVLDVYGDGELVLPENSYTVPPDWNYLAPDAGQHYRYSFYYDGTKFDWNRSVRYDA